MKEENTSAEELKTIRKLMEESTRFLSLSGFSGVLMGLFAIAGAAVAWFMILDGGKAENMGSLEFLSGISRSSTILLISTAAIVLILSLASGFYFSWKNAKRSGVNFWTPASRRMLTGLLIPLASGGFFALILLFHNQLWLIIPVFLIFYGLALINAGKFTYGEITWLGIFEIVTGLAAAIFPGQGLLFWILGFGILHIVYGVMMYRKYKV
jgi:hypothetical protein